MAQQTVNLGTVANDGTGDSLRVGGDKINDNFTELYDSVERFESVDTLVYAASVELDFSDAVFKTISLTGNIEFTTANLAAGKSKTIRIICDGSARNFTFPAGWKFVGAAAPASITASKVGVLTLTSFSTTDANVIAAYAEEP